LDKGNKPYKWGSYFFLFMLMSNILSLISRFYGDPVYDFLSTQMDRPIGEVIHYYSMLLFIIEVAAFVILAIGILYLRKSEKN